MEGFTNGVLEGVLDSVEIARRNNKLSKSAQARNILTAHPEMSSKKVARQVGCSQAVVYSARYELKKSKVEEAVVETISIDDACMVLFELANLQKVLIQFWEGGVSITTEQDTEYKCKANEVAKILSTLRYLDVFKKGEQNE